MRSYFNKLLRLLSLGLNSATIFSMQIHIQCKQKETFHIFRLTFSILDKY